ncbi:MAG: hypothetical protein LBH00_06735 [Planctomycetaceae bacterium]|jgi:hypothetical protein|nr:hypothetical protein [Planctomycetaceae bacterium]
MINNIETNSVEPADALLLPHRSFPANAKIPLRLIYWVIIVWILEISLLMFATGLITVSTAVSVATEIADDQTAVPLAAVAMTVQATKCMFMVIAVICAVVFLTGLAKLRRLPVSGYYRFRMNIVFMMTCIIFIFGIISPIFDLMLPAFSRSGWFAATCGFLENVMVIGCVYLFILAMRSACEEYDMPECAYAWNRAKKTLLFAAVLAVAVILSRFIPGYVIDGGWMMLCVAILLFLAALIALIDFLGAISKTIAADCKPRNLTAG